MRKIILFLTAALFLSPPLRAEKGRGAHFLRFDTGSRAAALAGALTAAPGGLSPVLYNPAAAGSAGFSEIQLSHNEIGEEMRLSGADFIYPSPAIRGAAAVSIKYFDAGRIEAYAPSGLPDGNTGASAFSGSVTYAPDFTAPLYTGLTLRFINEKLDSYSDSALAADLGFLWKTPAEGLSLGASVLNIGTGMKFIERVSPLPLVYRAGAAYSFRISGAEALLLADCSLPAGGGLHFSAGAEMFFHGLFALRAGWDGRDGLSNGLRLGGGLAARGLSIDYSWQPRGVFESSHRISAGFRFGRGYSESLIEANLRERFEKGEKLYHSGRFLEAYSEFRNILLVAPRHREAGEYISRIEVAVENIEARKELEAVFDRGVRFFGSGDLSSARAAFDTVLALQSGHSGSLEYVDLIENRFREVAASLAERAALHYGKTEYARALEEAEKALAIDPENLRAAELRAAAAERLRELEERRRLLREEQEERIRQRNIESLLSQGNSGLQRGRWLNAAESYASVLELEPGHTAAREKLGESYAGQAREERGNGRIPEALEYYGQAARYGAPVSEEYGLLRKEASLKAEELNRAGLTEYARRNLKQAEKLFEESLRHNPDLAPARENLSRIRREME